MTLITKVVETEGVKAIVCVAKRIPYQAIGLFAIDTVKYLLEPATPKPWLGMLDGYEVRVAWKD